MATLLNVAVIGAGVAGLRTALELKREGHQVVVFEKLDQIGGTWVYTPQIEEDSLGLNPNRRIVHSSIYSSLRTNLPRCLMGFSDYPFKVCESDEQTNFPGHEEVLQFLKDFARDFELIDLIRFNTEVVRVEQVKLKHDQWLVEYKTSGKDLNSKELFDAVVICNGHNTQPRLAKLPGIEKWPGKQIHSHNYRVPEPFQNKVVVVIGFGPSAHDIAIDIAKEAKEVHISTREPGIKASKLETHDNLWLHYQIKYCHENGEIAFEDGASIAADVIIYCTGFNYSFPFLKTNGIVSIDDNRVGPLYKHVFPPKLAPRLSFVGITRRAINLAMNELQARWVAKVISGKVVLPPEEEMLADVEKHYQLMEQNGVPKYHTHTLPFNVTEYFHWIAAQIGEPPMDKQLIEIHMNLGNTISDSWVGFRDRIDKWDSLKVKQISDK